MNDSIYVICNCNADYRDAMPEGTEQMCHNEHGPRCPLFASDIEPGQDKTIYCLPPATQPTEGA